MTSRSSCRCGPSEKPSVAAHGSRHAVSLGLAMSRRSNASTAAAMARGLRFRIDAGQLGEMAIDEAGIELPGAKLRMRDQRLEECRIGVRPDHDGLAERGRKPRERLLAIAAVRDHLGDHRIVIGRDHRARFDAGIDPHALACRQFQRRELAGRRQEAALRILGIKPRLGGVAVDRARRVCASGSLSPAATRNCSSTRSSPVIASVTGCSTCSRVFISMNQKPSGRSPRAPSAMNSTVPAPSIADRARGFGRGAAHRGAHLGRHAGRGRLLDHLLMAALQRAVALVEMDDVAVAVGEHLHLDVARRGDVFLDQHARIAERRLRLARRAFERGIELGMLVDAAHALAAAARDRLDQHRIADLVGLLLEELRVLPLAVIAGHDRHAGLLHQRLGLVLQPHGADRGRRRTDEHDAGRGARFGELRVLRQEAVAGMDAVAPARARGRRSACRSTR